MTSRSSLARSQHDPSGTTQLKGLFLSKGPSNVVLRPRRRGNPWLIIVLLGALLAETIHTPGPLPAAISDAFMSFFSANELHAASFLENETKPRSIPFNPPFGNDQEDDLFGMETEPVAFGELTEKWRQVQAAIDKASAIVAQCHANGPCPFAAQRLIDIVSKGAGRTGRARVGLINRAADLAISPTSDQEQWGVSDHWSDPLETLRSNRGDCEDYAIIKYVALLEAGVSKNDVKIVLVKNLFPNEDHALAAARVDGRWLLLDNRTLTLVHDTDVTRAIPEFALDHEGVKRFIASRTRR